MGDDLRLESNDINKTAFNQLMRNSSTIPGKIGKRHPNYKLNFAYGELCKLIEQSVHSPESLSDALKSKFVMVDIAGSVNEAHKIFNLVNTRGIRLTNADIIKSHIFGDLADHCNDTQMHEFDQDWTAIITNITDGDKSDYDMDAFLRLVVNMEYTTLVKKSSMVEIIKSDVEKNHNSESWLRKIGEWSNIFLELRRPRFRKTRKFVRYLNLIKEAKGELVYLALMAGYKKSIQSNLSGDDFDELVSICFRYHLRAKTLPASKPELVERALKNVADIIRRDGLDKTKVVNELTTRNYPDQESTISNLKKYRYRKGERGTVARHLLVLLEKNIPVDGGDKTVEHSISQKNSDNTSDYIHSLGNLALLSSDDNIEASNKLFKDKHQIYSDSGFAVTRELAEHSTWSEKTIKKRLDDLACRIEYELDIRHI